MSAESRRIRVLLADDHTVMREGLQLVLERSEEFEVVGHARDGVEAVKAASELSPDVIVMDVMMPNKDGVEACREIMESLPDTRVIMLTASTEADAVIEAVAAGATGYLQKMAGMDQLLSTVKVVAAGEMRLPTDVVRRVFARIRRGAEAENEADLTPREKEILALDGNRSASPISFTDSMNSRIARAFRDALGCQFVTHASPFVSPLGIR